MGHLAGPRCTACAGEVVRTSAESAAERALASFADRRVLVVYARAIDHEEHFLGVRDDLVRDGYRRIRTATGVRDLDEVRPSDVLGKSARKKQASASIEVAA